MSSTTTPTLTDDTKDNAVQPTFALEKLYVRDLSLETPAAPECFLDPQTPEVKLEIETGAKKIRDGLFDVLLHVTIRAETEGKVLFLVEVAQAGIFRIENIPETDLAPILAITCPNMLLPFAREAVADAITRAGFPPVLLAPLNFEALYQMQQQQAEAALPAGSTP